LAILKSSGLDFTILRPGRLLDEAGSGKISASEHLEDRQGSVSREDVASSIMHCLGAPSTIGRTYDIHAGETPIAQAF